MSNSEASQKPNFQPAIRLVEFKVTNVSFNAGDSFETPLDDELKINLGYGLNFSLEDSYKYTVNFNIKIFNKEKQFELELDAAGLFETNDEITDEFKESHLVKINSPAIAFPFVRSFVNTFTSNAGLNPIMLPSINFANKQDQQSE